MKNENQPHQTPDSSDEREFQEQIEMAKIIMDENKKVLARLAQ